LFLEETRRFDGTDIHAADNVARLGVRAADNVARLGVRFVFRPIRRRGTQN
jgi:hypothetical protein